MCVKYSEEGGSELGGLGGRGVGRGVAVRGRFNLREM